MEILAKILATITRHPRHKVTSDDFKWSKNSWVHNIMRVYELIFWRRDGIRHEMSAEVYEGKIYYACYSWESSFAMLEQMVRHFFSHRTSKTYRVNFSKPNLWGGLQSLFPYRIYIPQFSTPEGVNFSSGYMFAIALDTSANHATGSFSYTCTGSNLILIVGMLSNSGDGTYTGTTYNSVSLTLGIDNDQTLSGANQHCWLHYLINPATGANTLATSGSQGTNGVLQIASYTGAKQSGQPDATAKGQATSNATSVTAGTLTVVASNCWVVAFVRNRNGGSDVTNNSGVTTTSRSSFGAGPMYWDSNGTVSAGSNTVSFAGNNQTWNVVTMSIAPFVASATANPAFLYEYLTQQ